MLIKQAPPKTRLITGEEMANLGDIGPAELVAGRIQQMTPTGDLHGGIELNFGAELKKFVQAHKLGKVRVGEVGVYTRRNPDTVRGVDALFISHERYSQRKSKSYLDVAPDLIVEVLSPNDSWTEVTQKLREYFDIGVRLVWVVDPEAQAIYAYRSLTDIDEFVMGDDLTADDVLPGFAVPLSDLFDD